MMRNITLVAVAAFALFLISDSSIANSQSGSPYGYDVGLSVMSRTVQDSSNYETEFGDVAEGVLWYFVESPIAPASTAIYKLKHPSGIDSMDSLSTSEGIYTHDDDLGYVYDYFYKGLATVSRFYNPTTGDHMTGPSGENQSDPRFSGYIHDMSFGQAFYRFGQDRNTGGAHSPTSTFHISGGQTSVTFDADWGGLCC